MALLMLKGVRHLVILLEMARSFMDGRWADAHEAMFVNT